MTSHRTQCPRPVIVGTDGSACSAAAIQWAALAAERRRRPLWIVRVFDPVREVPSALDAISPVEQQRISAEIDLSEAVGSVDVDTPVERVWLRGDPVRELSALASDAELLVVGSRGLGGLGGVLLGSTSLRLALRVACPVAVVRAGHAHRAGPSAGRVVAAVDGRPASDRVLEMAFDECELRDVGLTAVHTYMPSAAAFSVDAGIWEWPELHEREDALLSERLAGWRAKHPDVDVVAKTLRGYSGPALVAESSGAELIVMPRGARTRLHHTTIGAPCRDVLHLAQCPVLIIPDPPQP